MDKTTSDNPENPNGSYPVEVTFSVDNDWNEDLNETFLCRICNKTFYNAVALKNHKNLQHDVDGSSSEDIPSMVNNSFNDNNVDDLSGFKFISSKKDCSRPFFDCDEDLKPRVFTEDITYLVIKVLTEDADVDLNKKKKMDGVHKKTPIKPVKQTVDLRGPFTCNFPSVVRPDFHCRQIFFNCCEYSLHYREEHTKRRKAALRCQVCEKRLDIATLPAAPEVPPTQTFGFWCRTCGRTFLNSYQYDEHNRLMHAKTKPHHCTICSKRFTQQGGLQQHMRMHSGIRPFTCVFCPKAFTQKAGLDQHLRTHTKVKPFKCIICNKSFSQSIHLRQHMRTHTNIQPFECTVCGRRFKQTSHLNFHMRSHDGDGTSHPDNSIAVHSDGSRHDSYTQLQSRYEEPLQILDISNLQQMTDDGSLFSSALNTSVNSTQSSFNFQGFDSFPFA